MDLPPADGNPESDDSEAKSSSGSAPAETTAPNTTGQRTLSGVPFSKVGPEFYKKYGGKAFLLRPVSSIPTKTPQKLPAKGPENPAPTDKKE
ncbi:MAG: hypothetical protein HY928_16235 [Elusimicrobia bacterium]|nr:hypothetical protein [Elusimicrobiota bacterium]